MSDDLTSTIEFPAPPGPVPDVTVAVPAEGARLDLLWDAIRHPGNHKQAFRFLCVGTSGFVVNNLAFFLFLHACGLEHTVSFWAASLIGTINNFWWNRHWTFDAKHHHVAKQGVRFLIVSLLIMALAYGIYLGLVGATGLDKGLANALAWVLATPFSFLAQKLWSFRA